MRGHTETRLLVNASPNESTVGDNDIHLVRRFQQGDLSTFEQLVENYKQSVVNYAARVISDPTEAEDIAQKAFVRVFSAL